MAELSADAAYALASLSDGLSDEGWRNTNAPEILRVYAAGETPADDTIYNCYTQEPYQLHEFLDELLDTTPATHERARWFSYLDENGWEADIPELSALRFANYAEAAQFCLDHCLYA